MTFLRLTVRVLLLALLVVAAGSSCSGRTSAGKIKPEPSAGNHAGPGTAGAAGQSDAGTGSGGSAPEAPLCPDPMSCGDCGACVADPLAPPFTVGWSCVRGSCVASCFEGTGDCDGQPGCETALATASNCGQCGRKACAGANTLLTCSAGAQACVDLVCAPGFANCDTAAPDCETAFDSPSACFPGYVDTIKHYTRSVFPVTTIGPDGSLFLGGDLDVVDDFDPTDAVDERTPGPAGMAYITKVNPDGSYAWTRTFEASFMLLYGLAADANGVVAIGAYRGSVDFDPGAGTALQTASGTGIVGDAFVLSLSQAGEYGWAHSLFAAEPNSHVSPTSVVLSGDGVYLGGAYSSTTDFDPGPGQSPLSPSSPEQAFMLKLDASGRFDWVRSFRGVGCNGWVLAMTAAPQGRVWVAGLREGPCSFVGGVPNLEGRGYVAAFAPDGEVVGEWGLGAGVDDARAIAAAADGSVFVGGALRKLDGGDVDLDSSSAVDLRGLVPGNTGFVTKLAADGSYVWSRLMGGSSVAVAATPDGGLLASGLLPDLRFVSKLGADGAAAWSLGFFMAGDEFRLAAGKTGFVVAGVVNRGLDVDFDPAPGVREAGYNGQTSFFSRYTY